MNNEFNKTTEEQPETNEGWEAFYLNEQDEEWEKEKKRRKKRKSFILKLISVLLVFSLLISGLQIWFNLFNIPAIQFLKASNELSQNHVVQEHKKSVVTIEWDRTKGTGFNIHQAGLIVTNEHVVEGTGRVKVHFQGGSSYTGEVIAKSKELDLALVDIDGNNLPVLPLNLEKDWEASEGENIIFIGNPLAFTQIANEGTVAGPILLQDWKVPVMMIDAPVYKGNSGSPVINQSGEVIGIIFATISSPESNKRVGVAIPAIYLEEILQTGME
ncbi:Trypsin-like peptidase domain-containing protein [Mesobacillus persicus]|uniref:Trypsin-like peptidase domain-containing protein n=1 Tax=Mesobacillus persicus TaxID=930146 RepID=A0A1H7VTN4_9BACI|nr:serine protease [Mesobacillus persicus]SEM12586.1 Trypsin-like peptidase domain-containing protein [Mesobacillus persicus]